VRCRTAIRQACSTVASVAEFSLTGAGVNVMEDTEQISVNGSLSSERASVSSHDFEEPDEKKGDTKSPNRVLTITLKSIVTINMAPPIGIYQLVNYLQKYGIGCDVLDRELEDLQVYIDKVRNGDYDVVGISVSHQNMTEDLEALWKFMEAVRDGGHHTKIVAGGQEATLNWRQWIDVGVEVAFLGFAEKAFLEFCRRVLTAVDNGTPQDIDDYVDGVPGVAYRDRSGEYIYRHSPPLTLEEFTELCGKNIMGIDIPFHDYWDIFRKRTQDLPRDHEVTDDQDSPVFIFENIRLYTTSHCPRQCGFCNAQTALPRSHDGPLPILMMSAQDVEEIILMYYDRYQPKSFLFSNDDLPVGNRYGLERLRELCRIIIGHKESGRIDRNLVFFCQARVFDFIIRDRKAKTATVDMELLRLMKAAGFTGIGLGVETFSERILKAPSVNKVGITVSDCRMVIDAMLEVGLVPKINLIIGIPEYTPEELAETIETAIEFLHKGADVDTNGILLALPGAPMFDSGDYEICYEQMENPITGETVNIAQYFFPQHPTIRAMMEGFDKSVAKEMEAMKKRFGWGNKVFRKRAFSVANMLTAARLMDNEALVEKLDKALVKLTA